MRRILLLSCATVSLAAPQEDAQDPEDRELVEIHELKVTDGKREGEDGVLVTLDFTITNCEDEPVTVAAFFYDGEGKALRDRNGEYASEGVVATWADLRPGFDVARERKFTLFLPWNELHLTSDEEVELQCRVQIYWKDEDKKYHNLYTSEFHSFPFRWPHKFSGEIANAKASVQEEELRLAFDATVRDIAGKARVVAMFYRNFGELKALYRGGDKDQGVLSTTWEFAPEEGKESFPGQSVALPTEAFPLKTGRNKFHYKLWLQVHDGERWVVLDATKAREFHIENGSVRLAEVWVIPEFEVRLDWEPTEKEEQQVRDWLKEGNRRLYDALDGQVRIGAFKIVREQGDHDHNQVVMRIYKDFARGNHGKISEGATRLLAQNRGFTWLGSPDKPKCIHIPFENIRRRGPVPYGGTFAHEVFHSWFGLADEYGEVYDEKTKKSVCTTICAIDEPTRLAWNACIVGSSSPMQRELCTAELHPPHEKLHELDCYTRVKIALKEKLGLDLFVPDAPIDGPTNPPDPEFRGS